jgi:hypothetical protein
MAIDYVMKQYRIIVVFCVLIFYNPDALNDQPAAEFARQDIVGTWKAFNGKAPACEFVFFADSTMNIEVLFLPYEQDAGYLSTKCKEYITHEEYRRGSLVADDFAQRMSFTERSALLLWRFHGAGYL